jgi:hypothetical protein
MECCLLKGELVRRDGKKGGLEVRCTSGVVWLTRGDGVDYLVGAGSRVTLGRGESALAEALQPAELHLGDASSTGQTIHPVIGLAAC